MYLAAFRAGDLGYNGDALISDDAGQFNYIYDDHGLCWIHELRHYKLIEALHVENKLKLSNFFRFCMEIISINKNNKRQFNKGKGRYYFRIL